MSKINNVYTKESELKAKRKKLIKNSTYALIVTLSIMLGATLVAVNLNSKGGSKTVIQTSAPTTSYTLPLQNAVIVKDYNSGELQYNDTLKQWEIHKAMDLVSETSAEVVAIADGTVTNLYSNYLEGTVIEISHSNGLVSIYKSLTQETKVNLGDSVKKGTQIGTASNSMSRENNSGNHLHFEMYLNKVAVNPNDYIDFSKK